jgi:hypothetical protein
VKKFIVAGIVASALVLTGCGAGSGVNNSNSTYDGGFSDFDVDMNNRSAYNDRTYCGGDTYVPLGFDEYTCEDKDHKRKKAATKRPSVILPKRVTPAPAQQQKAPTQQKQNSVPPQKNPYTGTKPQQPAPKAPSAPKAPAKTK